MLGWILVIRLLKLNFLEFCRLGVWIPFVTELGFSFFPFVVVGYRLFLAHIYRESKRGKSCRKFLRF